MKYFPAHIFNIARTKEMANISFLYRYGEDQFYGLIVDMTWKQFTTHFHRNGFCQCLLSSSTHITIFITRPTSSEMIFMNMMIKPIIFMYTHQNSFNSMYHISQKKDFPSSYLITTHISNVKSMVKLWRERDCCWRDIMAEQIAVFLYNRVDSNRIDD